MIFLTATLDYHTHIADDFIYLKPKQIVDITELNGGVPVTSDVLIKDKFIAIQSVFDQVCEYLWTHINSLDVEERKIFVKNKCDDLPSNANDCILFKEQLTTIIKENVQ